MIDGQMLTVLPDTNLLMHYRRIDEIDWTVLTGSKECCIAIAPIVLRELDDHKVNHHSKVVRQRCKELLARFVEWMSLPDPITLRSGVTLVFLDEEPETSVDFAAERLTPTVNDDRLIASALACHPTWNADTAIATADAGMMLKLRSRPLKCLRLPDDLKLPDAPDPDAAALKTARTELARLQASRPELSVRFVDRSTLWISPKRALVLPPDLLDDAAFDAKHPPAAVLELDPSVGDMDAFNLPHDVAERAAGRQSALRYNSRLAEFRRKYVQFRQELISWLDLGRRTHLIRLALFNEGGATATRIDVEARFPPGTRLISRGGLPDRPKTPSPPAPPGTSNILEQFRHLDMPSLHPFMHDHHDGKAYVDPDESTASFSVAALKQGCELRLGTFHVVVPQDGAPEAIQIQVSTTYDQGQPVPNTLVLRFEPQPD